MCGVLRESLSAALKARNPQSARAVIYAMHTHMFHGHPNDPRNVTPAR